MVARSHTGTYALHVFDFPVPTSWQWWKIHKSKYLHLCFVYNYPDIVVFLKGALQVFYCWRSHVLQISMIKKRRRWESINPLLGRYKCYANKLWTSHMLHLMSLVWLQRIRSVIILIPEKLFSSLQLAAILGTTFILWDTDL